jgi:hypothetical protein
MAAFFYPVEVLVGVGIVALLTLAVYEAWAFWQRRRLRT